MHAIGRDASSHSKTPGKFVPDMWKSDPSAVQEFEALKKMNTGTKVINRMKATQLMKMFNLKTAEGKLGNTGISIGPHTNPGSYTLQK